VSGSGPIDLIFLRAWMGNFETEKGVPGMWPVFAVAD
jgi:hypothetical protein